MIATETPQKRHSKRKITGAHYTPSNLASFVANRLLKHVDRPISHLRVMDPACGEGELLQALAAEFKLSEMLNCEFLAIDDNPEAIENTKASWAFNNLIPLTEDFLSLSFNADLATELFSDGKDQLQQVDLIIANPPYVRTQILGSERAQQLALAYDLTGRVDLYHAFLVAMTRSLRTHGLLGVITSNRFLSTKGGSSIRDFLLSNFDILEIIDLGDTKLFEAAVLPAIFIGRKRDKYDPTPRPTAQFMKIYEESNPKEAAEESASIYEVLTAKCDGVYKVENKSYVLTKGSMTIRDSDAPWQLTSASEQAWVLRIEHNSSARLGDLLHVRVGVKTTADKVFIRDDWGAVPEKIRPEGELLRSIIDSSDCKPWKIDAMDSKRRILYPYTVEQSKRIVVDLNQFPKAKKYFEHFRARLEGRNYLTESSRDWYEIWVPHHPDGWQQSMLVVPDISPEPRFLYTNTGAIVNGNCYWLTLRRGVPVDYLFLILGIANSRLMTRYHDLAFNNKLYSGRRRYLTQYLEKYPIPSIASPYASEIIDLVKERIGFQTPARNADTLRRIESCVEAIYGLREE